MDYSTNTTFSLEFQIVHVITGAKKKLTNSEIRIELHKLRTECTKLDVNKTLQKMNDHNILQFHQIGNYKYWSLAPGNNINILVTPQTNPVRYQNIQNTPQQHNNNNNNNNKNRGMVQNHTINSSRVLDDKFYLDLLT